MKVQIDEDGMLRITAETRLEAYALRQWCKENTISAGEEGKPHMPTNNIMFHFVCPKESNQ